MPGRTETPYSHSAPTPTLMEAVCAAAASRQVQWAISAGGVLFMTALTAAAAQVSFSIPFTEVPFTFGPMAVLMSGLALGPRLGLLSQVLYLTAGMLGAPVFAMSPLPQGVARLIGPTGGYLMSYPIAAFVTGYLAERGFDRRLVTSVLAMLAGLAVIFTCGVLWLGLFARTPSSGPLGISVALDAGFYPFVVADILKILVAATIMPSVWRLIGR